MRDDFLRRFARKILWSLPHLKQVVLERDRLRAELERLKTWDSPIPSVEEIKRKEQAIFRDIPKEIPGVDLNEAEQIRLLERFRKYYKELPFQAHKRENLRYFFENTNFGYADAIVLYCMIRHARPNKIIEVGSGYSSCAILDTNELFFNNEISCTFIEPHPQLLQSLIKESDKDRIEIVPKNLQDVDLARFSSLSAGDILFIDSSHISKIDSDVNYAFFRILPYIRAGVYIHFHDIFYPFEYPKKWVYQGISYNESYLLKAFLQYNEAFKIQFFNHYLSIFHRGELSEALPLCMENTGGSIWIRKLCSQNSYEKQTTSRPL